MESQDTAAGRYFDIAEPALDGLDTYLNDDESPLYKHDLIGTVVTEYLARLRGSLRSWEDRVAFADKFRISRAESGFPVFQNLLELENDRRDAGKRLAVDAGRGHHPRGDGGFHPAPRKPFPPPCKERWRSGAIWDRWRRAGTFRPLCLPRTVRVSVNPKTKRPYYVVHWGYLRRHGQPADDLSAVTGGFLRRTWWRRWSTSDKLKPGVDIPLPVDGLLNPVLAHQFDDFCDRNSAYSLTLSTIATNLDKDFPTLHPKQLRRFVLGPFYSFGDHGQRRWSSTRSCKR